MSNPTELPDLDRGYFKGKLAIIVRDLSHYTAKEMARELVRLAKVADESEVVKEARRAQPEGEAPQAAAPDAMTAFRKWHQEVGDQDCEYTWLQAWTAAQLSKSASAPGTPEAPADQNAQRWLWVQENIRDGYELPGGFYLPDHDTSSWDRTVDAARAAQLDGGQGEEASHG